MMWSVYRVCSRWAFWVSQWTGRTVGAQLVVCIA